MVLPRILRILYIILEVLNQRGTIQIPIKNLLTGLYLVKIETEKGILFERVYVL